MIKNIGVIGAGSWGATLGSLLADKGYNVTLWEHDQEQAKSISSWRALSFFPHLIIPKNVLITNDLKMSVENKDILLFVVPSHTLRDVAKKIALLNVDFSKTIIVSAVKGIENNSLKRMSEIILEELPGINKDIVVLSGPTHAAEVCQKIPTAITAASTNEEIAKIVQSVFMTPFFRVYTNSDVIGVETGGALKNIFAIAAGICDGIGLGDNTKAALVTRGLNEIIKLGTKMKGHSLTFLGLTGLGDLIVTSFSKYSRNRAMGEKIGKGKSIDQAGKEIIMVAEGVKTTKSAYELAKKYNIELPIIEQVYNVIYLDKSPKEAVNELMVRDPKPEIILSDE